MVASKEISNYSKIISLEDYLLNPPERTEWVEGKLVEKIGMTAKHGRTQARLATYWTNYKNSSSQGGEVYTETPCRTVNRGRSPDVSYLTPELLGQFPDFTTLPQSFPLIAEIISPTDTAEDVFNKANEYLASGCQELWLIFPESQWIVVLTQQQRLLFTKSEVVSTQVILPGFSVGVDQLLV